MLTYNKLVFVVSAAGLSAFEPVKEEDDEYDLALKQKKQQESVLKNP